MRKRTLLIAVFLLSCFYGGGAAFFPKADCGAFDDCFRRAPKQSSSNARLAFYISALMEWNPSLGTAKKAAAHYAIAGELYKLDRRPAAAKNCRMAAGLDPKYAEYGICGGLLEEIPPGPDEEIEGPGDFRPGEAFPGRPPRPAAVSARPEWVGIPGAAAPALKTGAAAPVKTTPRPARGKDSDRSAPYEGADAAGGLAVLGLEADQGLLATSLPKAALLLVILGVAAFFSVAIYREFGRKEKEKTGAAGALPVKGPRDARSPLERLLAELDGPAPAPEEVWDAYQKYRSSGGGPGSLEPAQLYEIFIKTGRRQELLKSAAAVPLEKLTALALKLSSEGDPAGKELLGLADPLACSAPGRAKGVISSFESFSRTEELFSRLMTADLKGAGEAASAFGRAFCELKMPDKAERLLSRLPEIQLKKDDVVCLFQAKTSLNRYDKASSLLRKYIFYKPVCEHADYYYSTALGAEKFTTGAVFAREIYEALAAWEPAYKDAAARAAKLAQAGRLPSAPEAKTGLIGGQFELIRRIGKGAMGEVFEGLDKRLGRKVALKKMIEELNSYPEEKARFVQEAQFVARLNHPYIVNIHTILEEASGIYLVLDFVEGRTVADIILSEKRVPAEQIKEILNHVCQALDYLHKSMLLHRDIKPANIMVDINGTAKLMDLGLATEVTDRVTRLTRRSVAGTPLYMAPEQHKGFVSAKSDLYALGACTYEMLTGVVPFQDPGTKESGNFKYPTSLMPWVSPRMDDFFITALNPEPNLRFSSAAHFYEAFIKAC
ncbi:MAG: hypothetical protein A2X35_06420 [Elusimicrobia bacterium GWA2_61_42]|nr:MAG: hypothetical protein A2X35_06420 [Elusimicrobia bacterium GWA2_61_42]OGR78784.1 MAG: hypothetical protein A2X38_04365 [Elusimicrobia bacterium GWC2_61_25]